MYKLLVDCLITQTQYDRDEKGQLGNGFSPCASSECKNAILFSLLFPHEVTLQMQKENMLNVAKGDHFVTMLTIFFRKKIF